MLSERSKQVRRDVFALSKANGGYHFGGTLSCIEILISLYDHILDLGVDRFILSKGHACWGYYVLLRERGFDPSLEGHPHLDLHNGVHWTTGSEGHGFPAAVGMALARKVQNKPGRIYVLIGDGECQEGTTWESMLMAVQHRLDNLTVIVDFNKIQGSGFTRDILSVDCLGDVAEKVGWIVRELDGHNVGTLSEALCRRFDLPYLIIAHTVKGKGVSYMEDRPEWHANWPKPELVEQAMAELV